MREDLSESAYRQLREMLLRGETPLGSRSSARGFAQALASVIVNGDLDGDGFVGSSDLDLVRGNWGASFSGKENGDANGDGVVDSADLDVVRGNWGQGTPAAVPEPGGLMLLAGVVLLGAALRCKA